MSYYDNPQWSAAAAQNSWEHQGTVSPMRAAGASGPQPQDDFAFSYQFDEIDRAYENLQKSGKGFAISGRHIRGPHGAGPRSHSVGNFDDVRTPPGPPNLHNLYAAQRLQPSRGTNEAEQVMQAKRRMAAQRERELRNLHTEQQYQRNVLAEVSQHGNKHMSEEETRELIARQRSALYGEGPFADKSSYIDETGNIRPGPPGASGPSSLRGASPMTFEGIGRVPSGADSGTPNSLNDPNMVPNNDHSPRPQSTTSPQAAGPTNRVFDNALSSKCRTSNSSPTGGSPPRDQGPGSKTAQATTTVAPIGTRPAGHSVTTNTKRSSTPMGSSSGWGRGNAVWGQPSGLGAQASVWG